MHQGCVNMANLLPSATAAKRAYAQTDVQTAARMCRRRAATKMLRRRNLAGWTGKPVGIVGCRTLSPWKSRYLVETVACGDRKLIKL
jgi:hypothetical protein